MAGIAKKVRFDVFKRDGFACQYCGRTPPVVMLELDHVLAKSNGGSDDDINLITACFDCNRGKSDRPLTDVPISVQDRVKRKREALDQVEAFNALLLQRREVEGAVIERIGLYWFNQYEPKKNRLVFGDIRARSIRTFLQKLTEAEILDSVDIAFNRKPNVYGHKDEQVWRYFCGVCWKKIREREGEIDA